MLKDSQEKVWKSLNLAFASAQKKSGILHSADWIIEADVELQMKPSMHFWHQQYIFKKTALWQLLPRLGDQAVSPQTESSDKFGETDREWEKKGEVH